MDKFTKEKRSEIMSAIRGRDTRPELLVRKWLFARGYRFRVCDGRIAGHPDVVIPRLKTIIEIRGCFWHRHGWTLDGNRLVRASICPLATVPKTHRAFWNDKFRRNIRRDIEHEKLWLGSGWNVIAIWECELRTADERNRTFETIARFLSTLEAGNS